MSSTVSSIFSTDFVSDHLKFEQDIDLAEILLSRTSQTTPVFTSALNTCYTRALLLLHKHVEELDVKSLPKKVHKSSPYNVNEDDFDATVFPERSLSPSITTISQWRHEQISNEKFGRIFIPLVTENMYTIVLNWIKLELKHEEERGSKNNRRKQDLQNKCDELIFNKDSTDVQRLYELSEDSKDILIEQVDWKSIVTKLRRQGNFKYFDEYSLKRLWIFRYQYGLENRWSEEEDQLLNQLVEQLGYGKWIEIAQNDLFQSNRKSAFMCAQRYMMKTNKTHAKRRFPQSEKDRLLSLYKHRCSVWKDYRFCVSHAAYMLGDRCIREITHAWTYINPDIQKKAFTPEEDAILLEQTNGNSTICWATIASSHLPDRSAVQCRQRYLQLTKPQSIKKPAKQTNEKAKNSRSTKYTQWLERQPVSTQIFLAQFYGKIRMTHLQQSIIEMYPKKIESLLNKFSNNQNAIKKFLPLREFTLKLNLPTVSVDDIYAKFVNHM